MYERRSVGGLRAVNEVYMYRYSGAYGRAPRAERQRKLARVLLPERE